MEAQAKSEEKVANLLMNQHPLLAKMVSSTSSKRKPITDVTGSLLPECQALKKQYRSLVKLIPYYTAKSSIDQALQLINGYIVTRKLDKLAMQNIMTSLNSVSYITPQSIQLLQNFLNNPTTCDLRDLTEKLSQSLKNLNNIIELKENNNERE